MRQRDIINKIVSCALCAEMYGPWALKICQQIKENMLFWAEANFLDFADIYNEAKLYKKLL